ncbi:MAG: methylated-DNA--[protein]-cysteine S-methyltransferase [Butyrivibrio sp.]|nr:methylated-DNA--[protein]-cysteine S-methyltransferase [Acetatifactor muris]MCM1560759.1 methylated-DNA--[protein]-cysteine S-methyltransferase [Butyrivibrio sp.]
MQYTGKYESPLGGILLAADEIGLTGLWFEGQKYFALCLDKENEERQLPVFEQAGKWLDVYFKGKEPDFKLPLHFTGSAFQNEVWEILYQIPYGQTVTYGSIAKQLSKQRAARQTGSAKIAARAVGGAVAHNQISVIVPCHRVVGGNGSLTGYAGGIDRKIALLKLEKAYRDTFFVPVKSTAP